MSLSAEPDVSVVIPTYNEAGNITTLLAGLDRVLGGDAEIIFVDDSTDDTPGIIAKAACASHRPMVLLDRSEPTGGLGGAVVAGIEQARGRWIVVMDADLQHPPELAPRLVAAGDAAEAGLVVASRYTSGGSRAGLGGLHRVLVSSMSTHVTKLVFARRLRGISDPMSGYFAIRREIVRPRELNPIGFKILLELIVRTRPARIIEVAYIFGERHAGNSKSSLREGLRFLRHLMVLRLAARRRRPAGLAMETP